MYCSCAGVSKVMSAMSAASRIIALLLGSCLVPRLPMLEATIRSTKLVRIDVPVGLPGIHYSGLDQIMCIGLCEILECTIACYADTGECILAEYVLSPSYAFSGTTNWKCYYDTSTKVNIAAGRSAVSLPGPAGGSPGNTAPLTGTFLMTSEDCFRGATSLVTSYLRVDFAANVNVKSVTIIHAMTHSFYVYHGNYGFIFTVPTFILAAQILPKISEENIGTLNDGTQVMRNTYELAVQSNRRYLLVNTVDVTARLFICQIVVNS